MEQLRTKSEAPTEAESKAPPQAKPATPPAKSAASQQAHKAGAEPQKHVQPRPAGSGRRATDRERRVSLVRPNTAAARPMKILYDGKNDLRSKAARKAREKSGVKKFLEWIKRV